MTRIARTTARVRKLLRRAPRRLARTAIRTFLRAHDRLGRLARRFGRPPRPLPARGGADVLLTGTFHAEAWAASHLRPLAASPACRRVSVVSVTRVPSLEKVDAVYPPRWLRRLVGGVPARLLTFAWRAFRDRPDIVGGFHLLLNGLFAGVLAPLVGARSLYICVGGPAEVLGGGVQAENRLFRRLGRPDADVERRLVRAVGRFDLVVTMGRGAVRFYRERGVARPRFAVIPGGIDAARFAPRDGPRPTDLIVVARLAEIKRLDIFLEAVALAARSLPSLTATIVGDGPLREPLEERARALGLEERVAFVGRQRSVEPWLRRARAFLLTSDSEGLSLSLMEAMMAGLPAVVSDVGDLGELVTDGVNGYLVASRDPAAFAARIVALLSDERRLARFALAAREAAAKHDVDAARRRWDAVLGLGRRRAA